MLVAAQAARVRRDAFAAASPELTSRVGAVPSPEIEAPDLAFLELLLAAGAAVDRPRILIGRGLMLTFIVSLAMSYFLMNQIFRADCGEPTFRMRLRWSSRIGINSHRLNLLFEKGVTTLFYSLLTHLHTYIARNQLIRL